jgi:hypothetical protein
MARKMIVELVADPAGYTRGLRTAAKQTKEFEAEVSKATRGVLTGSGAVEHLGRSVAFASGGFLAFASAGEVFRSSIEAARDASVTQAQLAAQLQTSGVAWDQVKGRIEDADLALSKISGFNTDELEKSFTTLYRSSGSISKALYTNAVAADVARGRHISLAQASIALGKALAGSHTALQRLGIILPKSAHGMDAIRIVAARFAGQAQAGATASDRFAAALHNTEVTIGNEMLPTLNRLLTSTTDWLDKSENQKRVADDVHQAVGLLVGTFKAVKAVLDTVNTVTGSTANTVKVLFGAFVAFKAARFAIMFAEAAASITAVGTAAEGATVQARLLVGTLDMLAGPIGLIAAASGALLYMEKSAIKAADAAQTAASATFTPGAGLETTLVPRLAKQIEQLKAQGKTSGQILTLLRQQLGGSLKADDLIGEAFTYSSGSDPKLTARINAQVAAAAKVATKAVGDSVKNLPKGATTAQRNTWFDNMISRDLGRVQDIPSLKGQIGRLGEIAALIQARMAATKDVTRKLTLEDQLLSVLRQQRQDRTALAGQIEAQAQASAAAAKAARDAAVQTKLGWLDFAVERAQATKTIKDDVVAYQAKEAYIKTLIRQEGRTLELVRQLWETRQAIKELNKKNGGDVDPLAGLEQVSSKQLASMLARGTGISRAGQAILGANIAGAEIQPVHVHVHMDGREIANVVTKHQARGRSRTAQQTSGYRG